MEEEAERGWLDLQRRVEKVDDSALFRSAYVKRRCIIPASGFYEWTGPKTDRVPHHFTAPDGDLLGFAGLWEQWRNPETGEEVTSCTIITREAERLSRPDAGHAGAARL